MPTFAAVDIGSNSCRLKIASVQDHKLVTLHEDREVVRLGESVFQTGVISPEAMALTIRALRRFHKAVQLHVVDKIRVVATSAMRDARNAAAFTEWTKSATGWTVEVISGLEEGRLIHLGVATLEPGGQGKCLLIDLGGGSCEVTLSDRGRVKEMVSLPLGAVRLQQEFLLTDPPAKTDVARLQQYIDRELTRAEKQLGHPKVSLVIATSGTAAALAEASLAVSDKLPTKKAVPKDFVVVKPDEAHTPQVRALAEKLVTMTNAEREAVPGIGPKRSEIIIGGAFVYASLLERFGLAGFRYSPLGLRDGMLEQMLGETDLRAEVHEKMETERWAGVLEVSERYGVNQKKSEPILQHALELFDGLKKVHELPDEYRLWLQTAAMLQEVGKFMNHQGHHRHTQYIIANSEIFGFSPEQRLIVSAIARYLGKSRPEPADRVMRQIPIEEHVHVTRAIVLLRLAVALNQDRASAVVGLKISVYPKRVVLDIVPGRGGAELEVWALKKEASYFREVLRRELFVDVE
ncbi:exopolyphosphatase / guanosine-5'-triphosphate,3'-diphosphate pyrophosphatase [Granulicella rosea]|uniref:Exopolyphosphatase / guanosine-5'-triphosphate,3'-diphosphate pyrophosphatase n=1 Tax=Granulicella rosea TaxID=474952 RepID=A0A239L3Z0_9BACT|nr:Ppx/GppA phosphatase family protein [Granulicella rosea]SNT24419.1 exopolyphosphatase / guanosine-5'-triphosphate,3'-diphosphate pyrophosphatase [Granulicella rosea]